MTTETTAKRGRPAKQNNVQTEPKKAIFKEHVSTEKKVVEYELLQPGGIMFMLKAGPVSVYDKDTDSIRSIRYIPQENTVYTEEQTAAPLKRPIIFQKGRLFVNPNQPNLAKFMAMHPGNKANGGKLFREVDMSKDAAEDMTKEFKVVDALNLLRSKPVSDLLAVATALDFKTDRPMDEIKHDLMVYAKRNPGYFIEAFDNPIIEAKALVKKAIDYGVISMNKGKVSWTDTNNYILSVPVGRDAVEVVARYCLTEDGSSVLNEIKRQL